MATYITSKVFIIVVFGEESKHKGVPQARKEAVGGEVDLVISTVREWDLSDNPVAPMNSCSRNTRKKVIKAVVMKINVEKSHVTSR